ncbi:MAG: glucose 1-dehydrogenase [Alphaproteobacteria bacterium]|nr:glucose 1-dehydrogenase [Alphaproteobacteria bacterium]
MTADLKDLAGKTAIVTGSSSGLGAAVVAKLARRGADVVVNYLKSEREAKEVAAACEALGAAVLVAQGNVAEDADCRRLAAETLERFGRIDILVNNAGTTKFVDHADLEGLSADDFRQIYSVNVIGAFQMLRACSKAMKAQGYGAVVNISSVAGVAGIGSSVAYAASKGALNTMTLSLARALAPEIRVNAVCPGYIATPWFEKRLGTDGFAAMNKRAADASPLKQTGTADLVSDAVVFLCTEGARHITGETLLSDAGIHLSMTGLLQR